MSQTCPNCQNPNPAHAQFCHSCGTRFSVALGSVPQPVAMPPAQVFAGVGAVPAPPGPFIGQPHTAPKAFASHLPHTAPAGPSKLAITSLVLAILSLFCFGFLTGVPAAIVGWMELAAIQQGRSDRSGAWMAHVGLWGGIVMSVLSLLGLVLMIILSAASAGMNDPYMSPYGGYYGY
jgi:hypothetical protein